MDKPNQHEVFNREISWLAFNYRVLQEAADKSVPLVERFRFLGIYSNNLDEFFRVRVAALNRMINFGKAAIKYFEMQPEKCVEQIQKIVLTQTVKFEKIYQELVVELYDEGIVQLSVETASKKQKDIVLSYYQEEVKSYIVPIILSGKVKFPLLKDKMVYLAVKLFNKEKKVSEYALIQLPTNYISRFFVLPNQEGKKHFMMLDDIVRLAMKDVFKLFKFDTCEAFTIKLTRDAELDIEEDISKSLMEKLEESIDNRRKGDFTRFVYDAKMPDDLLDFLRHNLNLTNSKSLIAGGRYHNFKDFIGFPDFGISKLVHPKQPPVSCPGFSFKEGMIPTIRKEDVLVSYPFHNFDATIDFLREAAIDPSVKSIKINIYRVASNSRIMNTLIAAAQNGKNVTVVLELQARFDEKNNLYWSNKLQDEGCKVQFGISGLKVHAKLISVERTEGNKKRYYTHIGTGNFHEENARLYTDHSLFTANQKIGKEVSSVFKFLKNGYTLDKFEHLFVSPFNTRQEFVRLIDKEIELALEGKLAYIKLKLNNLQDSDMIQKLYEASKAGVKIQAVIRGICCLIPGVKGMSENITVTSIVGRYLEHSRVFFFGNNGDEKVFIASADWMTRNLDRRVEVTVPIYNDKIKNTLNQIFEIYLSDNTKARIVDERLANNYVEERGSCISSQQAVYSYFKAQV
jgi:polyphosphate kinase